jgi:hypothetical protein
MRSGPWFTAACFDGPVAVGSRWVAHEKFGPRSSTHPPRSARSSRGRGWVSFPPMKADNRGKGGRVIWGYELPDAPSFRCPRRFAACAGTLWVLKRCSVASLPTS